MRSLLIRSHHDLCSKYYYLIITPVAAGKTTEIFCGNMKVLLFKDDEYKGSIFKNYNIGKKLMTFI
jgi:hypothetical protein